MLFKDLSRPKPLLHLSSLGFSNACVAVRKARIASAMHVMYLRIAWKPCFAQGLRLVS